MDYSTVSPTQLIESSEYAIQKPLYARSKKISEGLTEISKECFVYYAENFFPTPESLQSALDGVCEAKRPTGEKTAFNYPKPRDEVVFHCTPEGDRHFKYGGRKNPSIPASKFDLELSESILEYIRTHLLLVEKLDFDPNKLQADQGVNVHYSPNHPNGGSVGDHQDTHPDYVWPIVAIVTFGQSRCFHIRDKKGKNFHLNPKHGSLLIMIGSKFQKKWYHGVPKITSVEHNVAKPPIGHRVSWNIRYKLIDE